MRIWLRWMALVLVVWAMAWTSAWWYLGQHGQMQVLVDGAQQGKVLVFRRAASGHYRWAGQVGGAPTEFLIDTGAARTTVPQSLATLARLTITEPTTFSTASGKVQGGMALADITLNGGLQLPQLKVAVIPNMGTNALLGMDVLTRLKLELSGNELRVTLPPAN